MRSIENGNAICCESLLGATRCFFAPIEEAQEAAMPNSLNGSGTCLHHWLCSGLRSYDLLGVGLVICDQDGRLLGSNRSANALLEVADGLQLSDEGEFCVIPEGAAATPDVFLEAIDRARCEQKDIAMLVKRSGNKPAVTVIVKARIDNMRTASATSPLTLVLLIDPSLPQDSRVSVLQRRYGFSPEESRLANLLAEGFSLDECCDELAISNSKGRRQLAALLRKSGVHREGELIALLERGGNGDLI